jgi:hypothetical protein
VNLFSYLLGYSRRQYLRFTASADLETTVREQVGAFEHLGGVAATCLYDKMKVVVARYEDDEPIYNTRFLAFAVHYGFRPVACRRRRPQTKGKVDIEHRDQVVGVRSCMRFEGIVFDDDYPFSLATTTFFCRTSLLP